MKRVAPPAQYSTRALERGVDLLSALSQAAEPIGVSALATELKLSKATVFRLLQTLVGKGLVAKEGTDAAYSLSPRILTLGARFLPRPDLVQVARPHLEQLRRRSKETATLSVRVGDQRVFLEVLASPLEVRMVPETGRLLPLVHGASGKLLLAFAEPPEQFRILRKTLGSASRQELADHQANYERIREAGYAWSVQERTPGGASIAAAVRDGSGDVLAAIAISAPAARLTTDQLPRLAPSVLDAARRLSHDLRWTGQRVEDGGPAS
jgi:DNA-binding IclR family transcriptional regulator